MNKSKPNPDYVSSPFECKLITKHGCFVAQVKPPEIDLDPVSDADMIGCLYWIKIPERTLHIWDGRQWTQIRDNILEAHVEKFIPR